MVHNRKPRLPYRICSAIGQCLLKPWLNKGVPSKFLQDLCHLPNSNNQQCLNPLSLNYQVRLDPW